MPMHVPRSSRMMTLPGPVTGRAGRAHADTDARACSAVRKQTPAPIRRRRPDDVDRFWWRYFGERGAQYAPASRHWYEKRVSTACAPAFPGDGPFYCPRDAGLYLDTNFIQEVRQASGDFPVAYVFAHEVVHHAQDLVGITQINAHILLGGMAFIGIS